MREPWALMAPKAAFTARWRDSNCTIRADDHRNERVVNTKDNGNWNKVFLEFILPTTMVSDSASHARTVLASSSAA